MIRSYQYNVILHLLNVHERESSKCHTDFFTILSVANGRNCDRKLCHNMHLH